MRKLVLFLAAIIAFLPATLIAQTPTPVPEPPTPTPFHRPIIFVRSFRTHPSPIVAGQPFELFLELHNSGSARAEHIVVTFASDGFVPEATSSVKPIPPLDPGASYELGILMRAHAQLKSGTHELAARLDYNDPYGLSYTSQEVIGVGVIGGSSVEPRLLIERLATEPTVLAPGTEFEMALRVRNVGGGEAKNVLITPKPGSIFTPMGTGGAKPLASLKAGWAITVTLRMVVSQGAEPGTYSQGFLLECEDLEGNRHSTSQDIGLTVSPQATDRPQLLITGFRSDPHVLYPGDIFAFSLTLQNVGRGDARRVLLTLGREQLAGGQGGGIAQGVFVPLESTNVCYVPYLSVGTGITITRRMMVNGTAGPGAYMLSAELEYEDTEGKKYSSTQVVSLLVARRVDLRIRLTQPITQAVVGEEVPLYLEVLNAGLDTVNVTTMEVKGKDFEIRDGSTYIGALDGGASNFMEARVVPQRAGKLEIQAIVHYLDDFNQEREVIKGLFLEVEEIPEEPVALQERPEGGFWRTLLRFLRGLLGLGG